MQCKSLISVIRLFKINMNPIREFYLKTRNILIPACMALFFSCEEDRQAPVPAYLQINEFQFQGEEPDSTGYPTQRISDVWIFVNNQIIGTYSIPTGKIPVIAEGKARVSIQAGIFTDGMRKNRVYYPFYKAYEQDVVLEKGKTKILTPHFFFLPAWKSKSLKIPFTFYEDFEVLNEKMIQGDAGTVQPVTAIHSNTALRNLYGNRYLEIRTVKDDDVIDVTNDVYLPLETNGNPVYLEFDYKSTCPVQVGLRGRVGNSFTGTVQDLILYPNSQWTKIYVSLSEETGLFHTEALFQQQPATFRFFLRTIPAPGANNTLCIDNIRLLN